MFTVRVRKKEREKEGMRGTVTGNEGIVLICRKVFMCV